MTNRTMFQPHKFLLIVCMLSLASVLFAGEIHDAASKGDADRVKALIAANPELVNADFGDGRTPLYLAAENGRIEVVKILVKAGANVDTANNQGIPPLGIAMVENHADVVMFLLESGAKYNANLFKKRTVLNWAAAGGDKDIIQWLIQHGVDPNSRDQYNMTALHWAARGKQKDVAILLLDNGTDVNAKDGGQCTPIIYAGEARDRGLVELLVERGADVNEVSGHGFPVSIAASAGDRELLEFLIAKGADVNGGKNPDQTPLAAMTYWGNVKGVRLLLDAGADVNAKDSSGQTALHWACRREFPESSREEAAQVLIGAGANPNLSNKTGWTPLHIAVAEDCKSLVRILLKAGADPTVKNEQGRTAIDFAMQRPAILDVLREFPTVKNLPPRDPSAEWNLLAQTRVWSSLIESMTQIVEGERFLRAEVHPDIIKALNLLREANSRQETAVWPGPVKSEGVVVMAPSLRQQDIASAAAMLEKPIREPGLGLAGELNKMMATELKSWCEILASIEGAEEKAVTAALQKAAQQEDNKQYDAAMATLYETLRHRSLVDQVGNKIFELRLQYEKARGAEDRHNIAQRFVEQGQKSTDLEARIDAYCMSLANEDSADVLVLLRRTFDEVRAKQEPPSLPDYRTPVTKEEMREHAKVVCIYLRSGPDSDKTRDLSDKTSQRILSILKADGQRYLIRAQLGLTAATNAAGIACADAKAKDSAEAWQHAHEACLKAKESLDYVGPILAPPEESKKIEELLAECAKHMEK